MSSLLFSFRLLFVSLSSAKDSVLDITELFHVGLEVGLSSVPSNVADKQSRLILSFSLRSPLPFFVLADPVVFLRFLLSISLVSEFILEILSLLILILVLDVASNNTLFI